MLAGTLSSVAKLAQRISNPGSLLPLNRSLELSKDAVRACSEYGNLKILVGEDTGLTESCLINVNYAVNILSSLGQESVLTLVKNGNKVNWKSGEAKGHLTLVEQEQKIPEITHANHPWIPDENFADALLLASSACQAATVAFDLYGVVIEPAEQVLRLISTNTTAIAGAEVPKGTYPAGKVTLRPPIPTILAKLLKAAKTPKMDVTEDGIFITSENIVAHLPTCAPLGQELTPYYEKYRECKQVAAVDAGEIRRFLTRARGTADKHVPLNISLQISEGKLILEHKGLAAASEQFFLAEGLDATISYAPVVLPVDMIVIPLEHTKAIVLDYLGDNTLILAGFSPDFKFIIGGQEAGK
jgi:hypothetical protein